MAHMMNELYDGEDMMGMDIMEEPVAKGGNRKRKRAPAKPAAKAKGKKGAAMPKGKKATHKATAQAALERERLANQKLAAQQQALKNSSGEKKKKKDKKKKKKKKDTGPREIRQAKRDPAAPKLPMTAYVYFSNEKRDGIKAAFPNITFGEISTKLSALWRELQDHDKTPYEHLHTRDVGRYKGEMEYYNPAEGYDETGCLIGYNARQSARDARMEKIRAAEALQKKPNRDPLAPKPITTAYQFFANERRPKIKEEQPDLNFGQLSQQVSQAWNNLSAKDKAVYMQFKEDDANRYKVEMEAYVPEEGSGYAPDGQLSKEIMEKKRRRKARGPAKPKRDPGAPKTAIAAFLYFSKEMRPTIIAENGEIEFAQLSSIVGEKWRDLAPRAKQTYVKMADKDKLRYEEELKTYSPPEGYNAKGNLIVVPDTDSDESEESESDSDEDEEAKKRRKKMKKEKKRLEKSKKKDKNAPKPAASAFLLWSKGHRLALKPEGLNFVEMSARLGQDWKAMDEQDKEPYKERAAEDKVRFQMEMENYKLTKPDSDSSSDDSSDEEEKKPARRKRTKRDPNAPPPAQNAYVIWSKERRPVLKDSGLTSIEISHRLGLEWKQHSNQEKEIYQEIANRDKERYARELEIYEKNRPKVM